MRDERTDKLHHSFPSLHVIVFVVWLYADHYHIMKMRPPPEYDFAYNQYGGRLKFLTFLNGLLQCGYFGLCVLNDVFGSNTPNQQQQSSMQKFRDRMFSSLVFPLGVFVSLIFWALYAVDRELIFPESLDAWFPNWLNHVMHTLPITGAFLEVYFVNHTYQHGWKLYKPIIITYTMYLSWICYIAYAAGVWVYPVFEVLNIYARTVFLAFLLVPNVFFVFLGKKLHYVFWGSAKNMERKRK